MRESLQSIILGLVEGITEFIPVSSTGHLILVGHAIGFKGLKASTFEVFIQLGAILSILILYRDRFRGILQWERNGFYGKKAILLLLLTTLPAVVTGLLAHSLIKRYLFTPVTVALGLFIGGVWIVITEYALRNKEFKKKDLDNLTTRDALFIGLFQCLALWPGMSRSASTILGGLYSSLDRKTSAEYSFIAAVPIMFAATIYDLYKSISFLSISDTITFVIGFIVSFISAFLAVKTFIKILGRYDLRPFGYYRIVFSILLFYILL